ncbi:DUF4145 domain-containing protein [Spirulina sp. 06S082]|uniref:DUF4145 domain-containing protein n=1 Tax=Spirulina sp. 06S082 TaxID=3110248 RepID=UPI002B21C86F|nr:DUF4145 domain-containing protein [Spirulina sp. 06S082]MEA5470065.1 DUF4145 domain-containing protein [Spirulina sp. 06S082]
MLVAAYYGLHSLDLNSMFRTVAISTLYTNERIEDPIASSLSHFKQICCRYNVQLEYVNFWNQLDSHWLSDTTRPYIFVISGSLDSLTIEQILCSVQNGSNLIILSPPWEIIYNTSSPSFQELHNNLLQFLNKRTGYCIEKDTEIVFGQGKIFYIEHDRVNDLLLESGLFGGVKKSEKIEKEQQIESFIQKASTFNVPCVDCQVRSIPMTWPQDQPIVIEIELTQRSSQVINELLVAIKVPSSFEPLSTTEIYLEDIRPNSKRSIAVLVVPRSQGNYFNPVKIDVTFQDKKQSIFLPESQIKIISSLPELLRSSRPSKIDLSSTLTKYEAKLQPLATSSNLLELLSVDPDAVIAKVRRIGEHICKSIARRHLSDYSNKWTFAIVTKQLFSASILNSKAKGYIDTIRVFGNMAAHADDVDTIQFDHEDALSICYALVLFLKEVTEKNLI